MSQPYAVVCFIDEKESFSEIPTIWLAETEQECFWPSHLKNATQLMNKYVYPTSLWTRHNVRVEGYYKSDKMTPPPTPRCISSRKENKLHEALQHEIILLNTIQNDNTVRTEDEDDSQNLNSEENIVAGNNEFEAIKSNNYKLEKIYKLQIENNMLLKAVMSKLQQIEIPTSQSKISAEKLLDLENQFPILNLHDLAAFEQRLTENTDFKDIFYKFLKGIGGNSGKEFIHRCLKAVYSNELAVGCSWLGLRGNHKIASTQSIHWIKATIKEAFVTTTDKEFEKIVSEWFRLAKLRLKPHNKQL
ncbi:hypothetical protein FQR65_LT16770 [Abscondita terminalis]|nr:hypothetical protein FQR65_LT16770 [Abscondita terminalis]